jgi:hypothetical protein
VENAEESVAYTYNVVTADVDVGETLTISSLVLPAWLTLTDNGDGTATLEGTPAVGDAGDHAVSLQVNDGTDTETQDFTVSVEAAPAPPPPPPPPPSSSGGGGGAEGLLSLFALAGFAALGRRRNRLRR